MAQSISLYKYCKFLPDDSTAATTTIIINYTNTYTLFLSIKRLVRNVLTLPHPGKPNSRVPRSSTKKTKYERHKTNFTRENRKTKCQHPASSTNPLLPRPPKFSDSRHWLSNSTQSSRSVLRVS